MEQSQSKKEIWIPKVIEILQELGHKMIHDDENILTFIGDIESLLRLNSLPAKFQRQLDEKRVLEICEYQRKNYLKKNRVENVNPIYFTYYEFGISLPSRVNSNSQTSNFHIIDGQHRYYSFQKLFEEIKNFKVEYKVIVCENEDESYSYFHLINLSKPLVLHKNRNESEETKKLIDHIKSKYRKYVKDSKNPRLPNINLYALETTLRKHGLIRKCMEKEMDVVLGLESLNQFYQSIDENHSEKWNEWGVSHHMDLEEPKFYLGFYKNFEWICHWFKHIDENLDYQSFSHPSCISNERITKKLRRELWKKYFSDENGFIPREGLCYTCENQITEDNFQCGHIIARVKGGETKLNNLKPICSECNLDMKIENMNEYKERLERQLQ